MKIQCTLRSRIKSAKRMIVCCLIALSVVTLSSANATSRVKLSSIYDTYQSKHHDLSKSQTLVVEIELIFSNKSKFPSKQENQDFFADNQSSIFKQQMTAIISEYYLGQRYAEFQPEIVSVNSVVIIRVRAKSLAQLSYLVDQANQHSADDRRNDVDHVGSYNFSVEID